MERLPPRQLLMEIGWYQSQEQVCLLMHYAISFIQYISLKFTPFIIGNSLTFFIKVVSHRLLVSFH